MIAGRLGTAFHVRLVGSLDKRIAGTGNHRLGRKAALEFVRQEDCQRKRFLKRYFGCDTEDPSLYHMTINTDLGSYHTDAHYRGRVLRRAH